MLFPIGGGAVLVKELRGLHNVSDSENRTRNCSTPDVVWLSDTDTIDSASSPLSARQEPTVVYEAVGSIPATETIDGYEEEILANESPGISGVPSNGDRIVSENILKPLLGPSKICEIDLTEHDAPFGLGCVKPRISVKDDFREASFGPQTSLLRALPPDPTLSTEALPDVIVISPERVTFSESPGWCTPCKAYFSSWHSYVNHFRNRHVKRPGTVCKRCGVNINPNEIVDHERKHKKMLAGNTFVSCAVCPASFTTEKQLVGHKDKYHHKVPSKVAARHRMFRPRTCLGNGKTISSEERRRSYKSAASCPADATTASNMVCAVVATPSSSRHPHGISNTSGSLPAYTETAFAVQDTVYLTTASTTETTEAHDQLSLNKTAGVPVLVRNPLSNSSLTTNFPSVSPEISIAVSGNTDLESEAARPSDKKRRCHVPGFCWFPGCRQAFSTWGDYCTHYSRKHESGSALRCSLCLGILTTMHLAEHEFAGNDHKCPHCSANMLSAKQLSAHLSDYHRMQVEQQM